MTHQKINFRLLSVIVRKSFLTCVWCVFFRVSLQVRMLTSVCIMTLCFVVTTVLVVIDTSNCKLSAVGILDFLTKFLKSLLIMLWFNITSGNNIRQLILPYTRVKLAFIYKLYNLYYSITSWYTCIYLLDLGVKYIEIVCTVMNQFKWIVSPKILILSIEEVWESLSLFHVSLCSSLVFLKITVLSCLLTGYSCYRIKKINCSSSRFSQGQQISFISPLEQLS